ncbi:hypothetical protein Tco_1136535 [Tanacetum coccineum]
MYWEFLLDRFFDSKGAIPSKTAVDTKIAIQEMVEYSQKWHNGKSRSRSTETSDGLAAIQAQLNNLGREIKKVNEKVYAAQVRLIMEYLMKPIQRIQDFDELKDHCLTLKNTSHPHQRYAVYNTLVNEEEPTGLTSIRRDINTLYSQYSNKTFWKISNVVLTLRNPQYAVSYIARYGLSSNVGYGVLGISWSKVTLVSSKLRHKVTLVSTKLEINALALSDRHLTYCETLSDWERGFGSLPSSTEANLRDQVKSISTTIEADSYPTRRIGFLQYGVSTGQNRTLLYETRQTTIPVPSHFNGYYCEEKKGSYGPQFSEAYSEASHINNSILRKEKDPGSFTLPYFINNVCFDNSLVDLGASLAKKAFKERENQYLEDICDLEEKLSSHDRIVYKIGQSIQTIHMLGKTPNQDYGPFLKAGLGYKNPERLKNAIAAQPKMYNGDMLHSVNLKIDSPDLEETLEGVEENRLKIRNKMVQINYGKLNAMYETFVP